MKSKKATLEVIDEIAKMYPNAKAELNFHNPFELVIVVALSAQTTDASVNRVSPALFEAYPTPEALAKADVHDVMDKIKTIGLYRNKAKNIIACAQKLVEDFHGEVPCTMKELISLPGVGRKTANVVMSVAFGKPALAVDTHVERISKRLDLVPQRASVLEVEETLKKKIPEDRWSKTHHQMIFFGRYFCTAKNPKCGECPLYEQCYYGPKHYKKNE